MSILFFPRLLGKGISVISLVSLVLIFFPEIALLKTRKYREYALKKSGLSEGEFDQMLAVLFKYVKILPTESVRAQWKEALEIMGKVDVEDVVFIAAALSLPRSCV